MADQPVYQAILSDGLNLLWILALLVAVPLALIGICRTAIRLPAIHEFTHVPLLLKLTVVAGAVIGFVFILAQPEHASTSIEAIFAVGGPWDISFRDLLLTRLNPAAFNYSALIDYLAARSLSDPMSLLMIGSIVAVLASFVVCFRIWYLPQNLMACVACILLTAVTAYIMVYLFVTLLWGLNKLSYLMFLVLFLLIRPPRRFRGSKRS